MKNIIYFLLLLLVSFKSFGQTGNDTTKYIRYKFQYGQWVARGNFDTVLSIPKDTNYSKYGIAVKGTGFFIGNGTKWNQITGTGSGTDSSLVSNLTIILNRAGNQITAKVDTTFMSTIARLRDSTAAAKQYAAIQASLKVSGVTTRGGILYDTVGGVERSQGLITATSVNSNVGSRYRIAIEGTGNIKTIDPITSGGILIDTSTANILKIRGDSSIYSTVAKVRDSVANKIRSLSRSNDSVYAQVGTSRVFQYKDSAGGAGSSNSNVGSQYRIAIAGTNNIKTIEPVASAGISLDTATTNVIKIRGDTAVLSTKANVVNVSNAKTDKATTITINTQTFDLSTNRTYTVSGVVANGKWRTAVDMATDTINLDSSYWKISLSVNRNIYFKNLHEGSRLELEVTHTVAGTTIPNMPDLPWDFYWATGTGERTIFSGIYDSVGAKWNYNYSVVFDAAENPIYTTHVMLAFTDFVKPKLKTWYAALKATGYNAVWLHSDGYDATYARRQQESLDSAYAVGLYSIPGIAVNMTSVEQANVITDSYNHPGVLRYRGRRVYASYDFDSARLAGAIDTLTNRGIPRSSYWIDVSTAYPTFFGGIWYEKQGIPADSAAVGHVYDHYPFIDGIHQFSVDKASSNDSVVAKRIADENLWIAQCSKVRGKQGWAGVSTIYINPYVQQWNISYAGVDSVWRKIIALPIADRTPFLVDITANDVGEVSYNSVNSWPVVLGGSSYFPDSAVHSPFGANNYSYPQIDHSGIQKFCQPYIQAYLHRSTTISVTQDALFIDYTLHPKSASAYTSVPAELASNPGYTSGFWSGTPYASVPAWASDATKFVKFNTIKVAAHLSAPAQLRINGTLSSTTFPAGIAFYEVAQSLGTVTVEIVRGGTAVATGTSSKAITNNRWPGGGNALFEQIY